jgi:hypothetical protein
LNPLKKIHGYVTVLKHVIEGKIKGGKEVTGR